MLTEPEYGWTDFSLKGTSSYSLSYLNDIAFEWLEEAICGLKWLRPFCVKGNMEPQRVLCVVSFWNCYIVMESDERWELKENEIRYEYSHTSMLEFCKCLYEDVSSMADEWAAFFAGIDREDDEPLLKKRKTDLCIMLEKLKSLISERESSFGKNRYFM